MATKKSTKKTTPNKAIESSNSTAPIDCCCIAVRYPNTKQSNDKMRNTPASPTFESLLANRIAPSDGPILNANQSATAEEITGVWDRTSNAILFHLRVFC